MSAAATPTRVPGRAGPVWARWVNRFLARVLWNTRIVGAEHIPETGAFIVAANHIGFADGPILHGACPRGIHLLVKRELYVGPLGWALRAAGQIKVDRRNGRPALAAALAVLQRGGGVGVFPEGNRGRGDVSTARAGTAWLAVHSGAPVVLAAVLGTRRTGEKVGKIPGPRRRFLVEFTQPVDLPDLTDLPKRDAVGRAAEILRTALSEHVQAVSERTGIDLPTDGPAPTVRQ